MTWFLRFWLSLGVRYDLRLRHKLVKDGVRVRVGVWLYKQTEVNVKSQQDYQCKPACVFICVFVCAFAGLAAGSQPLLTSQEPTVQQPQSQVKRLLQSPALSIEEGLLNSSLQVRSLDFQRINLWHGLIFISQKTSVHQWKLVRLWRSEIGPYFSKYSHSEGLKLLASPHDQEYLDLYTPTELY